MKVAAFGFATRNIGDDMQSFAASCFLPRIDRFVDRDSLAKEVLEERHLLIMNSWFMMGEDFRRPPENIDPIFHGFCLGNDKLLGSADWMSYLREHGPIGCRDQDTVEILEKRGIDAYWSGCLTAAFGSKFPTIDPKKRSGIYFIDIPPEVEANYIPPELSARAVRLSTYPPARGVNQRYQRWGWLAELIDLLRGAELVVTRRLHAALPCIGFGTPVIAIPDAGISNARRRFSGFFSFLPGAFRDDEAACRKIEWDRRDPVVLPNELQQAVSRLQASVSARMSETVPDINVEKAFLGDRMTLRNPGYGFEPGAVSLTFSNEVIDPRILLWTEKTISLSLPLHALSNRMSATVSFRRRGAAAYEDHYRLSDLLDQ